MTHKKSSINEFLVADPQPTIDSILQRRLGASKSRVLPPLQSEAPPRQEMKTFMTTFRDTPNTVAHTHRGAVDDTNPQMQRSLEEVWLKGMYSKPAEMRDIDPTQVLKVDPATGLMIVPRYIPERFERGRVQQPHVTLEKVDPALFKSEGSTFMTPAERRKQHDTIVNCRLGEEALRDAYRARNKLMLTSQKKYPHGVANVIESPFNQQGSVYDANRVELLHQQRVANRIGKGHGLQQPESMKGLLAHSANVMSDRAKAAAPSSPSLVGPSTHTIM